ncbi:MAG: hypothetical protein IKJ91_11265 [Clostridia bacterium]|nr:hypothetical protein [Clostridia bacterium]
MREANIPKALLVLILALSVLLSLASCSTATKDKKDDEFSLSTLEIIPTETFDEENIAYPEKFTVLCEAGFEGELFASSEDDGKMEKSIFMRNAALSSELGITLECLTEQDIVKKATADMLSDDKSYDMLLFSAKNAPSLILGGALTDLGSISGWSEKSEGYSHRIINDLAIGEKIFLAAGDATPSLFGATSAILMNRELAARIEAETNIISAAKNGHFTYDMMLNYGNQLSGLLDSETHSASSFIRLKSADAFDLYISGGGKFFETDPVTDVPYGISFDEKEKNIYKSVLSLFGISEDDAENESEASTPLFTAASMSELISLAKENAPFVALPMPKSSVIQDEYICNADMSSLVFTAIPYGKGESELAVMNLIYKRSDEVISSVYEGIDNSNTAGLVYENAGASLTSLYGFGDIEAFMESCINERLSSKVFAMRAEERSLAASAALSIVIDKAN